MPIPFLYRPVRQEPLGRQGRVLQTNQGFDEFFSNLDTDRIMFLRNYRRQIQRATVDGVPINGYFQWSMMDFEWTAGFRNRLFRVGGAK